MKRPPLAGVRVVEHGQLLAVPFAARLLADLGAEVIKVEPAARLDTHRQTTYPDNEPGDRYWDRGGAFYSENRGKLGMTLDLRHPDAVAVFRDLVRVSDVVMENFTPRVMRAFGLDYDALRPLRPDLIMLSSTGYGQSGPWAEHRAVGPTTEAASGLAAVTGYAGGAPVMPDIPYTDYVAAEQGVLAVLLALYRRRRTGHGSRIDLSQVEAQAALAGELFLDAAANGTPAAPRGNRHPAMAPHGIFPCAGDDSWIAIAVPSDAEWRGLQAAIGHPGWAADPRYATAAGRLAHVDAIEARLSEWTRGREATALMHHLQAHGVPAGAVLDARDLVMNEQLRARGFFEWAEHPPGTGIEPKPYPGAPWRFSASQRGARRPAPALGEHNEYVLHDLLGYSSARVRELVDGGALGGPPTDFPRPQPVPLTVLARQGRIRAIDPDYRERIRESNQPAGPPQPAAPQAVPAQRSDLETPLGRQGAP
jgi:benzylsuccinate CoA-transferase BbsF subunit